MPQLIVSKIIEMIQLPPPPPPRLWHSFRLNVTELISNYYPYRYMSFIHTYFVIGLAPNGDNTAKRIEFDHRYAMRQEI